MADVIQRNDFYVGTSILHPLIIGSVLLLLVFLWVRVSSARALSGMTVFSMLVNLTLGSTMSRTITQTNINLVRGLISLAVIIGFEYVTDTLSSRQGTIAKLLEKQPELLVFRDQDQHDMLDAMLITRSFLVSCIFEQAGTFAGEDTGIRGEKG
ncbi:hypothetical protein P389DRAFT_206508 [Cystobasidium minutum MCA 4210]|uniref:uncharacterized protein n=1 Tax=Cystobasidium minutum MCA 4210 TaxID=1397322 RepID=UPI0034CFA240|eukprot:jgi/Rhomi1/206508/MIX7337_2_28